MISDTEQDLEGLKAAGKVVGFTIAEMKKRKARHDNFGTR